MLLVSFIYSFFDPNFDPKVTDLALRAIKGDNAPKSFGLASKEKNYSFYFLRLDASNEDYVNIVFLYVYSSSISDFSLYLSSKLSTIFSNKIRNSLLCSMTSMVKQLSKLFSKQ